jgi:formamidopyrimidine-DNA glycosylase
MPELPEVETVKLGLSRLLFDKAFESVEILNLKSFDVDKSSLSQLVGAKVLQVTRRGKALIIDLSSDASLVIHLKMTGQLVFDGSEHFGAGHPNDSLVGILPDNSTRAIFTLVGGDKLYFNDQRKFGWVKLMPTSEVDKMAFMKKLGPEPLEKEFTSDIFTSRIKRRAGTTVKAAILDQTVLAGVGNIYADEALWRAIIHPSTRVGEVSEKDLVKLHASIVEVLQLSVDLGGSSDRNYVNAEGKKGSYLQFAKVFRREGLECERCGNVIIKTRVAGRGTHTCPVCQPELAPRARKSVIPAKVLDSPRRSGTQTGATKQESQTKSGMTN